MPHCLTGKPLLNYSERDVPMTLLCHDMKGGYLDEERYAYFLRYLKAFFRRGILRYSLRSHQF